MNCMKDDETVFIRERQCIFNEVPAKQGQTFKMADLDSFISQIKVIF